MKKVKLGSADTVDGPYEELSDVQPFKLDKHKLKKLVHHFVKEAIQEASSKKYKILYHIGQRPGRPHPAQSRYGKGGWKRPWIKKDIGNAIFMSDKWIPVWINHNIYGNVYTYKIPLAAIKAAGGMHRYDNAREVLIPNEVWHKYNLQNMLLGKLADEQKAWGIVRKSVASIMGAWNKPADDKEKDFYKKSPAVSNFESLIKLDAYPEKQTEIIKLLGRVDARKISKNLENWINVTTKREYIPDVEYPWSRPGALNWEKEIGLIKAWKDHKEKMVKVLRLQKLLLKNTSKN